MLHRLIGAPWRALAIIAAVFLTGAPAQAAKYVRIIDLTCNDTTEAGEDEVTIDVIDGSGVLAHLPFSGYRSMNEDSEATLTTWTINQTFPLNAIVQILIKELDDSSADDTIGLVPVMGIMENGLRTVRLQNDGDYTLRYEITDFDPDSTFSMVIMSDPQFYYCDHMACLRHSSKYSGQAPKADDLVKNKVMTQSEYDDANRQSNVDHAKSIAKIAETTTNFRGVIVNGDITNTMDSDQLEDFKKYYQNEFVIYPGLGNHDYANYTPYGNDSKWCAGGADAISKHYCLRRIMNYLAERVRALPTVKGFDLDDKSVEYYHEGSYSYYWDIGDYRFIQLNNHPAYAMDFSVFVSSKALTEVYNITPSLDWLDGVLAQSGGKKVVLNMHGINVADTFSSSKYPVEYARFRRMLDTNPNVVAIFAGHIHDWIGTKSVSDHMNATDRATALANTSDNASASITALKSDGSNGRTVKIFFSGSAMFNMYLKVDFAPTSITVHNIDSDHGDAAEFAGPPVTVMH